MHPTWALVYVAGLLLLLLLWVILFLFIHIFFLSWLLFCIFIIGPSVTYLDGFTHVHIHTRFLMRGFVDGCMFGWVSDGLFLPVDVLVSGCCCCCCCYYYYYYYYYYYSMIQNKNNMIQKCSCSSSKIDFSLQHFCLGGPWREGGGNIARWQL